MAVRQYVGARYVPKFYENSLGTAEWQEGIAYEPLTIVTLNGNSFTSKKEVPANIGQPNLNPDYWASTGIYNAQIDEYREETAQAMAAAEAAQEAAEAAAQAEPLVWSRRRGKNIVFIGDSWVYGSGATERLTERFSTRIANALQMVEKNYGVGAAGFTRPGNTFLQQINTANAEMTADEKANTGIVCIVGGVNDLRNMADTDLTSFETAVSQCITAIHNAFPDALIVAAVCTTTNDGVTDTMLHWSARAARICNYNRSYPVLVINNPCNCINGSGSTYYQSDGLHPTTTGHSVLASHILNAILGGSSNVFRYLDTMTLNDGVVAGQQPHLFRKDEFIFFMGLGVNFNTEITENTVIGTIPAEYAPYSNIYFPFYRSNVIKGTVAILASGNVRLIPHTGETIASGYISPCMWMAAQ